jgi:hypothetical protein
MNDRCSGRERVSNYGHMREQADGNSAYNAKDTR